MPDTFKYVVSYGGGRGPEVWDAEIVVEAENIRAALDEAERVLNTSPDVFDYAIFAIEQQD